MGKKQSKIEIKELVLIIIVILLVIVNLIIYLKRIVLPKQQEKQENIKLPTIISEEGETETVEIPKTEEQIKKYLSTLNERGRMEYYCGIYLGYIEHKEYEKAYICITHFAVQQKLTHCK